MWDATHRVCQFIICSWQTSDWQSCLVSLLQQMNQRNRCVGPGVRSHGKPAPSPHTHTVVKLRWYTRHIMAAFHACKSSDPSLQIIISSGLTFAVHTLTGLELLLLARVSKLRSITTWFLQKKSSTSYLYFLAQETLKKDHNKDHFFSANIAGKMRMIIFLFFLRVFEIT